MSYDYNNNEVFYECGRDPRDLNVVERLKNAEKIKSNLPKVDDDHISNSDFQFQIATLEKKIAELEYDHLLRDIADVFANGGDITISENVDFATAKIIEKDINIHLEGKSITVKEDTVGDGVFHVTSGTLTIDGNGCINGTGKNDYNMAIWADGGNVIINGGTFTNEGATATNDPAHFDLIYTKNGATLEINGGFFRCATPKWTLNKHDSTESTIIVKGGTFVDYDPSHSETENPVANFVADGYKVISEIQDNGETWYTVVAE